MKLSLEAFYELSQKLYPVQTDRIVAELKASAMKEENEKLKQQLEQAAQSAEEKEDNEDLDE